MCRFACGHRNEDASPSEQIIIKEGGTFGIDTIVKLKSVSVVHGKTSKPGKYITKKKKEEEKSSCAFSSSII